MKDAEHVERDMAAKLFGGNESDGVEAVALIERIARRVRDEGPAEPVDGMTLESLLEWAASWVPALSPLGEPGQRERFVAGLRQELDRRAAEAEKRGHDRAVSELQDASEAIRTEGHRAGREEMLKEVRERRLLIVSDFDRAIRLLSRVKP